MKYLRLFMLEIEINLCDSNFQSAVQPTSPSHQSSQIPADEAIAQSSPLQNDPTRSGFPDRVPPAFSIFVCVCHKLRSD
jgi:hypothetical protein